MKNPLQTLLIVFALSLCGLCAWQWYGQVLRQKRWNDLAQTNYDQTVAIQGYTNSLHVMDHQIAQMDARMTELRDTLASNNATIFGLRQENNRLTGSIDQYSNAVALLEARLKQANDSIRRQNDAIKSLVQERDEFVNRLNQSIKERNDIVVKYNALVKQVEQMQDTRNKK